jgi:hypothetical protein
MLNRFAKLALVTLALPCLLPVAGCGPQFFSAKGTIASSGGALGQWSGTPVMCSRDEFDGDSSKLATFMFSPPQNNDPDRNLHRDREPNSPMRLKLAKNGDSYIAQLETMKPIAGADVFKSMDGVVLDQSNCKTIRFDRTEHMATMGQFHKPISGEVVLDCSVIQSHVTADIKFKQCGM